MGTRARAGSTKNLPTRARGAGAGGEPAIGDERAQDEWHRSRAVLLADVEDELPLLGRKLLGVAAVAPRRGSQRGKPTRTVGVVPALERGHRVAARRPDPRWAEALLCQHAEGGTQLAVVEIRERGRADDLAAEDGYGLGVVLGRERWGLGHRRRRCLGGLVHVWLLIAAPPG